MRRAPNSPEPGASMPVSVVMERGEARSGPWVEERWEAVAVETGAAASPSTEPVAPEGRPDQVRWGGLRIALYRDGCEGYWCNLCSGRPRLFVVCFDDPEAEDPGRALEPVIVTADQDEATGHMESDDVVHSVSMPPDVIAWLERYVVDNYVPERRKKRRRQDWAGEAKHGRPRAGSRGERG